MQLIKQSFANSQAIPTNFKCVLEKISSNLNIIYLENLQLLPAMLMYIIYIDKDNSLHRHLYSLLSYTLQIHFKHILSQTQNPQRDCSQCHVLYIYCTIFIQPCIDTLKQTMNTHLFIHNKLNDCAILTYE